MSSCLPERLLSIVGDMLAGNEISTRMIVDRHGIPAPTAKRYMDHLEHYLPVDLRLVGKTRFLKIRGK